MAQLPPPSAPPGRLLVLEPDHQAATGSLAYLLHLQGKLDEACACYLRLLELHPGHQTARHIGRRAAGERLGTAADEYVRTVFNGYADGFDDSLMQGLGYRVPEGLRRGVGLLAGADRTLPISSTWAAAPGWWAPPSPISAGVSPASTSPRP